MNRAHVVWPLLLPALAVLLAAPASARILNVPSAYPDIRAAVAAAASGDSILIAPGTYVGGAFIQNMALTFGSRFMTTGDTSFVSQTVLDGVSSSSCGGAAGCAGNSVLEFGDNAHGSAVIGLTVSNGENGIGSASSIVDILHCRVVANGDGLDFSAGAGGTFRDNLIESNSDDGIDLNGRMNVTISNNVIRNNGDDGIEYRLYAFNGAAVGTTISLNQIYGNGEDGVQFIDYPGVNAYTLQVDHNVFTANFDAVGSSAAIGITPNGDTIEGLIGAPMAERLYVLHNTFIGEKNGLVGGANVIALDNIFVNTQGSAVRHVSGSSIVSYGMFWNNGIDTETSVVDAPHLLHANPLVNADGTLGAGSPAIDAGTAFYQWNGETVLNEPPGSYSGSAPDLGAVESGAQVNQPPVVSVSGSLTVTLPAQALLAGTVTDDGRPSPPSLKLSWSVVSGAGPMAVQEPDQLQTRATFAGPGTYVVRLTASDGALSGSDVLSITVLPSPNTAPVVNAGPDQTITLPADVALHGTAGDDGLPGPPGAVSVVWIKDSGPGAVSFQNVNAADTRASFTSAGAYVLILIANDGALTSRDTARVTVIAEPNTAPSVSVGPPQLIELPAGATLDGSVSDDGHPLTPGVVTITWTQMSGPAAASIQNASLLHTPVTFTVPGSYLFRLSAFDGALTGGAATTITVLPPNTAPVVDAGPDQTITLPLYAILDASVSDDGQPIPPAEVSTTWSKVSGPGTVTFENVALVDTRATFSTAGVYVLRLTAYDGAFTTVDQVQITVLPVSNLAPAVDAGVNQTITLPSGTTLAGTVTDDGLPSPPASVTIAWSKGSGPGTVTFGNASAASTSATFSVAGTYILRLTANDGALSATDSVQIVVQPQPVPIDRRIAAASDDVEEETTSGTISTNTSDIELVTGATPQIDGLRFTNIAVARGTTIASAYIQFEADEAQSEVTNLVFQAQAADNAPTFGTGVHDVSARPRTSAQATWSPAAWAVVGEQGPNQKTGDLKAIIQEVVNRPGWVSGNAIAIIVSGTGHRTARSFESVPAGAALLHIETGGAQPGNAAPLVDAGFNQAITLPASAGLSGSVSDDGLPNPPGAVTVSWSKGSGPGTVSFLNPAAVSTSASFSTSGTYVLRLTANDGALATTDSVQITVLPVPNSAPLVDAGPNQTITLPAGAVVSGTVSDDGKPNPPGAVTVTWSKGSGPGTVNFQNANALSTTAAFTLAGTYVLRLSAYDGALTGVDSVQITVLPRPNQAPLVDAGPNQTITLPATAGLSGTASDDGLPSPPGTFTVSWTKGSGPGTVTFLNASALATSASFSLAGTYLLRLTVNDGALAATDSVQITVLPSNSAPVVDAGPNQTITLPAGASLSGSVSDDGKPNPPGAVTVTWSKGSGPGTVSFANANAASTTATFSLIGTYLLRLTASDGALATTDSLQITVLPQNFPPTANAGPDQTIVLPASATLAGSASDDGLPNPPGVLTTTWSSVSGPGPVTFQNASQPATGASFTNPGVYLLKLNASDGSLSAADTLQVTVLQGAVALERRIAVGTDDAEESATGTVNHTSVNLQLVFNSTNQIDGLRFANVTVPKFAVVLTAYVQFTANILESGATNLVIQGQAADNAATFSGTSFNVSSRPRTADSVTWVPPPWTVVGEAGPDERTPELKSIVQGIVNRAGWASGNALVLIVHGTGVRTAYTYDGSPTQAALLHVEYATTGPALAAAEDSSGTPGDPGSTGPGDEVGVIDDAAAGADSDGTINTIPRGTRTSAPIAHAIEIVLESAPADLGLRAIGGSPARGVPILECALPDAAPATLEVHDIAGRRIASREVGALGPGRHRIALEGRLPAGVYVARLAQAGRVRVVKLVLLP